MREACGLRLDRERVAPERAGPPRRPGRGSRRAGGPVTARKRLILAGAGEGGGAQSAPIFQEKLTRATIFRMALGPAAPQDSPSPSRVPTSPCPAPQSSSSPPAPEGAWREPCPTRCWRPVAGRPVFAHSAAAFAASGVADFYVVVYRDRSQMTALSAFAPTPCLLVKGGRERQDSVAAALDGASRRHRATSSSTTAPVPSSGPSSSLPSTRSSGASRPLSSRTASPTRSRRSALGGPPAHDRPLAPLGDGDPPGLLQGADRAGLRPGRDRAGSPSPTTPPRSSTWATRSPSSRTRIPTPS